MTYLKVPADLAQSIVNYLAARPFGEVHTMIPALMQCKQVGGKKAE